MVPAFAPEPAGARNLTLVRARPQVDAVLSRLNARRLVVPGLVEAATAAQLAAERAAAAAGDEGERTHALALGITVDQFERRAWDGARRGRHQRRAAESYDAVAAADRSSRGGSGVAIADLKPLQAVIYVYIYAYYSPRRPC